MSQSSPLAIILLPQAVLLPLCRRRVSVVVTWCCCVCAALKGAIPAALLTLEKKNFNKNELALPYDLTVRPPRIMMMMMMRW
jgi:hypothetical protein